MTHANFQICLKIYVSVFIKIVDLALRAVIDSFKIYTMKSLIKKNLRLIPLCSKLYLEWQNQAEQPKLLFLLLLLLLLLKKVLVHVNHFLIKYPLLNINFYSKFSLLG